MQADLFRWNQENKREKKVLQWIWRLLCPVRWNYSSRFVGFISKIVSHENTHVKHKYTPLPAKFWIRKAGSSNMFQSEDIDILSNLSFIWELNQSAVRLADSQAGYFLMISVSVHWHWGGHWARHSRDWLVIIGSDMSDICIVCFIIKISNTHILKKSTLWTKSGGVKSRLLCLKL